MHGTELPRSWVFLGAGGTANVVYWTLKDILGDFEVVVIEDESDRAEIDFGDAKQTVLKTWDLTEYRKRSRYGSQHAFQHFTLTTTDPRYKKSFVEKALAAGLKPAPPIIHPNCVVHCPRHIGAACIFVAFAMIEPSAWIGDYVHVTHHCVVGHHSRIGDYVYFAPGSITVGNVDIGEGVWLGAGCLVREKVKIAPWVTVGAQAAVVKDITEPGIVVAGVPARKLEPKSNH